MPVHPPLRGILASTIAALLSAELLAAGQDAGRDALGRPVVSESGLRILYVPDGTAPPSARPDVLALCGEAPPRMPSPASLARPSSETSALDVRWKATLGGISQVLGTAGIFARDFDGDGVDEIVVGHSMMWYVLAFEPTLGRYEIRHFHEAGVGGTYGGGGIVELAVGSVTPDGATAIVVLRTNGRIEAFDPVSGDLLSEWSTGVASPTALALVNLSGTAADEVLVASSSGIDAFESGSSQAFWHLAVTGDIAVGNLDGDPAPEIVVSGTPGLVIDGWTRSVEWSYSAGFGNLVAVGDVDGDGKDELAGAFAWGTVLVADAVTKTIEWSYSNFNTSAITLADVDRDGRAELLVGDAQWGDVTVYDGATGTSKFAIGNPEHSVANIAVGQVDGDCDPEILWGAGYTSSGRDQLYVAGAVSHAIEWQNLEADGAFSALAGGDVDGDGSPELLFASADSEAAYSGALVFVADLARRRYDRYPTTQTNDGWMRTTTTALAQADGDPQLEYVLNDSTTYTGKVSLFDGATHSRQWTSTSWNGEFVNSIAVADADDDGTADVLVATGREHTGATGQYVRMFRITDGAPEWQSVSLGSWAGVVDVVAADVDGDGATEILAGWGDMVTCWNGKTKVEEWALSVAGVNVLAAADVDADGRPDVLVGTSDGRLLAFDGATRVQIFSRSGAGSPISAVRIADVDGDGSPEIVLASGGSDAGTVSVRSVADFSLLWRSPPLGGTAGWGKALVVGDFDANGRTDIAVGSAHAVTVFEVGAPAADTTPPIWDGATGITSASVSSSGCCALVSLGWGNATDTANGPPDFEVFRSETSGTPPGTATDLAVTPGHSFVDGSALPGHTYFYVVRARDRAGNTDSNLVEAQVTTPGTPPGAPVITGIVDDDACLPGRLSLAFTHSLSPPAVRFDLRVDGILRATNVVSPVSVVAGDGLVHSYVVEAAFPGCLRGAPSAAVDATDDGAVLSPPSLASVVDPDGCESSGLVLTFAAPVHPNAVALSLIVDGSEVLTNVSSPLTFDPGDGSVHVYSVRAIDSTCTQSAESAARPASDTDGTPVAPGSVLFSDTSYCLAGSAVLHFSHPGLPSGHFELRRDGNLFLSPVSDGTTFTPGDTAVHAYVVRALNDACGRAEASVPVDFADSSVNAVPAGTVRIEDVDACSAASLTTIRFDDSPSYSYDLYRDGSVFLSPVSDGTTFFIGDTSPHSYSVKSREPYCLATADSPAITFTHGGGLEEAVPGTANLVFPAPGATGVPTDVTLSWTATANTGTYRIDLDETNPPRPLRHQNDGSPRTDVRLDSATTYFWRVTAIPPSGTAPPASSPIRSFTTAVAARRLTGVTPDSAPISTPTPITISGTGLTSGNLTISRDGLPVPFNFNSISDTAYGVTLYPYGNSPAGRYVVTVSGGGGSTASLPRGLALLRFSDVSETDWFFESSDRMEQAGVMAPFFGPNGEEFHPTAVISRGDMAEFLVLAKYRGSAVPVRSCYSYFPDVPCSHPQRLYIEWAKDLGITNGTAAGTFAPDSNVSRAEMAAFLLRMEHGGDASVPRCQPDSGWTDTDIPAWSRPYVDLLRAERITAGCVASPLRYCPLGIVQRSEISLFLARMLGDVPKP